MSDERSGNPGRAGEESTSPFQPAEPAEAAPEVHLSWREVIGDSAPAAIPDTIAKYNVIEQIGEGGMGAVFKARQQNPDRIVALKIMRPGVTSKQYLRRFEHEASFLGRLKHPGIATIYEADTFDTGAGARPFFAMEFVEGRLLTDYASAKELGTRDRLRLVADICDAVHHAHLHGIIHRDLKPGNILVEEDGQPKVLDFGVARATGSDIQVTSVDTDLGVLVGTIPYMSPEQTEGDPDEMDVRSDVYALGVVAYELLSGHLPYPVAGKSTFEVVRVIREEAPAPLSTTDRTLRGDVETIIGKALEKERGRRYASASDLALDIRRYLRDEPITARRPSRWYRLRKFTKRNRGLAAGLAAAFLVLVAGTAVSTTLAVSERRQRVEAERQTRIAREVNAFLNDDLLAQADPEREPERDIELRTVVERAAQRIEGRFADEPLVEAAIRYTLGTTFTSLGENDSAESHLQRALAIRREILGDDDPETLLALGAMAGHFRSVARFDAAKPLMVERVERAERVLGKTHHDTLEAVNNLASLEIGLGEYDRAETLLLDLREVCERELGSHHIGTMTVLQNLAVLYRNGGQYDLARQYMEEALDRRLVALGEDHPDTLGTMNTLAGVYSFHEQYDRAEEMQKRVLEGRRRVLGEEHSQTLSTMCSLGEFYRTRKRYDEAEELLTEALEKQQRRLGDTHPDTLITMNNLANLYTATDRLTEAEALYLRTWDGQRELFGNDHIHTLITMYNLGALYLKTERFEEAESMFADLVAGARRGLPEGHWYVGRFLATRARALTALERYEEAEAALLEAHGIYAAGFSDDHPRTLNVVKRLVDLYAVWRKPDEAAQWQARIPAPDDDSVLGKD